jgi:hypothetical protein
MKKTYQQPKTLSIAINPSAILCTSGFVNPDLVYGGESSGFGGG